MDPFHSARDGTHVVGSRSNVWRRKKRGVHNIPTISGRASDVSLRERDTDASHPNRLHIRDPLNASDSDTDQSDAADR